MKLTRENIYINLQGKSKEELTELYWLLKNNNNVLYRSFERFLEYSFEACTCIGFCKLNNFWQNGVDLRNRTEVTIQQLKEILQPMETKFKPIAMKCTQEQFKAIKTKLKETDGIRSFVEYPYLVNNCDNRVNVISNFTNYAKGNYNREVHEEWNEEIFLKACGIEVKPTLTEQLEKIKAEVKRLKEAIEEASKIKIGDWVFVKDVNMYYKKSIEYASYRDEVKITDQDLINKLNELIK